MLGFDAGVLAHYFDDGCINAVRQAMQQSGYGRREMVSGAGHDACHASKVVPTSMIFIPGIDGISHNEVEDAKSDWITAGEQVLLLSTLDKARGGRVVSARWRGVCLQCPLW